MLNHKFDPHRPYRIVLYLRMSSDQQNPRSPDQQEAEIKRRMKAAGYHWTVVKIYRDEGISGRLLRKRKAYQRMMRDLKTGAVVADLIVVDMLERFGRLDELPAIRKELFEQHGILILTSDSYFADPNTPQGRALGMVEAIRATEDGRAKAHNVLRGKRDAALQKHWPGGPPPFGYMLQSVLKTVRGREEVDYCLLVPHPQQRPVIELLFEAAERTSFGTTRLAKLLDNDPRVPDEFKPFQPETIGSWLDSEIYCGHLSYGRVSTGIVADTRVVQRNAATEVLRVPDFCEALVPRDRWNNVQAIRTIRRERSLEARRRKSCSDGKLLDIPAPGLTLNYLLSGLLFCECGLRMTASSNGAYTAKDGTERRYTSYVCPAYIAGHCANDVRVPEKWIRQTVVDTLRKRLLPEMS